MAKRSVEDILGDDEEEKLDPDFKLDLGDIYRGVTVTWLMNAFRMDRSTVRRRLAKLPPIKQERGNMPIYDFGQAASYLVKPNIDMHDYMRNLKKQDLPLEMQSEFWDAKIKEQKYKKAAGDLWHTNDVLEVFGETFKHVKTTVQLFISTVERTTKLSPKQREVIERISDDMLKELHEKLTSMKKKKRTASSVEEDDDADV